MKNHVEPHSILFYFNEVILTNNSHSWVKVSLVIAFGSHLNIILDYFCPELLFRSLEDRRERICCTKQKIKMKINNLKGLVKKYREGWAGVERGWVMRFWAWCKGWVVQFSATLRGRVTLFYCPRRDFAQRWWFLKNLLKLWLVLSKIPFLLFKLPL